MKGVSLEQEKLLQKIKPTNKKWTLETFLESARVIHGDSFDYSSIKEEDLITSGSSIDIFCKKCGYKWNLRVGRHIRPLTNTSGICPSCKGTLPWSLDVFISTSKVVHGEDAWDYSKLRKEHIQNNKSKIPLVCLKCRYHAYPTISANIKGVGCLQCSGKIPWTLETFLETAQNVHGNKYDYSSVTSKDIKGIKSQLILKCNKCKLKWLSQLNGHINHSTGCPRCCISKGENECIKIFGSHGIEFEKQYILNPFKYKYDFKIGERVIEYDGEQHFKFIKLFHRTEEEYENKRNVDLIKTRNALNAGLKVVRICYTEFKDLEIHLSKALKTKKQLYVSNKKIYKWILDGI